jgi:aspartokinase/homoserine dehydrogenase 1
LKRLPVPVLVDCTAADGMERVYEAALSRGVHVVVANKKALSLPMVERDALFAVARRSHRAFRYETTVGASLPVIETLQNLVRTGDRVHLIEGSLSGTLGYLSNEVSRGVRLSAAVRAARERGYTEPHPRDDLSGTDAARKALILARELGCALDLADVVVEPFVPAPLLAHDDVDAFLEAIAGHDDAFERRVEGLRGEGRVLRYLATITPATSPDDKATVRVGPVGVASDHPAARLRGTEALVAFRTERYSEFALVVQGAGAGGALTAAGVLADVLAISRARRGR